MTVKVAVVDHGAGNLVSISQGLQRAGAVVDVVTRPEQLDGASGVVLPGVGAMASVMDGIRAGGFADVLPALDVPLLGICVGMQVLFDISDEDGAEGLGIISGHVRHVEGAPRLPHIGWNDLDVQPDPLFEGLPPSPTVYFVHSYAPVCDSEWVIASTDYGTRFISAVRRGHVSGTQFHPERSGANGLRILANFVTECGPAVAA